MSQFLPTGNFLDLEIKNENDIIQKILNTPDDNEIGYFILVDLEYPVEIKELTQHFPLCPYKTKADPENFSQYI